MAVLECLTTRSPKFIAAFASQPRVNKHSCQAGRGADLHLVKPLGNLLLITAHLFFRGCVISLERAALGQSLRLLLRTTSAEESAGPAGAGGLPKACHLSV